MTAKKHPHFNGKEVAAHLKEARARGALATAETHGTEMPGSLSALTDSAKSSAAAILLLWIILSRLSISFQTLFFTLLLFSLGWTIWLTGRSAALGWARLQRLHRLIEQERWEIEHHRHQEKEELAQMYRAKGLQGKLLEEVVEVLMADDNRLLRVMLEEELGLTLEITEHPLKQAFGAAIGAAAVFTLSLLSLLFLPTAAFFCIAALLFSSAVAFGAKFERNHVVNALIWNLSLLSFLLGVCFFTLEWIITL